jgi:prepilin-type N-terminal cleavage/methylation domain-containing protein
LSHHNRPLATAQRGFTLIELLIVMVITLIVVAAFYTFFKTSLFTYLNLQRDATHFTELAAKSHRISNVVRGLTDITVAQAEEMTVYAYFYPTDTYVSLIHYYKNAGGTGLFADVTPMTANPPIGTPITADMKTYTIIDNFQQTGGTVLFNYLDSAGNDLPLPIGDLHTIKGIRINLGVSTSSQGVNQAMAVEVSLRNRKTNL